MILARAELCPGRKYLWVGSPVTARGTPFLKLTPLSRAAVKRIFLELFKE